MSTQKSRFEAPAPLPAAVRAPSVDLEEIADASQLVALAGRFQPRTPDELERLAERYYFANALPSSYYPKDWKQRREQWAIDEGVGRAYISMLEGAALGILPSVAIRLIHVINGVPTLAADVLFGRMLATKVLRRDDFSIEADKAHCKLALGTKTRLPQDRITIETRFEDYKHLHGKDNWRNHPEDMLVARAKSRAARRFAPDLFVGVYSTEEMLDLSADVAAGRAEIPAELFPFAAEQRADAPADVGAQLFRAATNEPANGATPEKHPLLVEIEKADATTDWAALAERCRAEPKTVQDALRAAWTANPNNPSRVAAQAPEQAPADTTPEAP